MSAFCDVDPKKIKCGAYVYHESKVSIRMVLRYLYELYHHESKCHSKLTLFCKVWEFSIYLFFVNKHSYLSDKIDKEIWHEKKTFWDEMRMKPWGFICEQDGVNINITLKLIAYNPQGGPGFIISYRILLNVKLTIKIFIFHLLTLGGC